MKQPVGRTGQAEINIRIVIEQPVIGVLHSLQEDDRPLAPQRSAAGEPLSFDFAVRVGAGPKFFGEQVRPEGKLRRFVYVRVGQLAGDCSSPWSRRMKIDIHDIDRRLLDRAMSGEGVIELRVNGTGKDASPACATVRRSSERIVGA